MAKKVSFARAAIWSALLQWSRVGIGALVFIVLARWLSLSEIGAVAAVQAPLSYVYTIQTSVFPDAVVQEGEPSSKNFSTVFWLSVALGALISLGFFGASFFVDRWVDHKDAGAFMRWLSICPFVVSLGLIQDGVLRKELATKKLAVRTAIASLVAGTVALLLGFMGHEGWALVWFTIVNVIISTALLFVISPWKPEFAFDLGHVRKTQVILFSLAGRYMISAAAVPVVQLLVSVRLGVAAGGMYQIAHRLYSLVDTVAVLPVRFLALPLFSQVQADGERLRQRIVKMLGMGGFVGFPIYFGLYALSSDLLPLVLGEKNGSPVVGLVRILCWCGVAGVVVGLANHALTSRGLAISVFKRATITVGSAVIMCLFAAQYSLEWVVIAYSVGYGVVGLGLAVLLLKRHLGLAIGQIAVELWRPFLAGISMGGLLLAASAAWGHGSLLLKVVCLSLLGAILYLPAAFFLARPHLMELLGVLVNRPKK